MSRVRATLVLAVTACVAPLPMTADPALAQDATPTLSASALTCRPENAQPPGAGSTRPGDYVFCQLRAAVLGGNVDHVTAVVTARDDGLRAAAQRRGRGRPD